MRSHAVMREKRRQQLKAVSEWCQQPQSSVEEKSREAPRCGSVAAKAPRCLAGVETAPHRLGAGKRVPRCLAAGAGWRPRQGIGGPAGPPLLAMEGG